MRIKNCLLGRNDSKHGSTLNWLEFIKYRLFGFEREQLAKMVRL